MIVMSAIHGVPEAPHLQDRDLEAFRTQWLIIESIAVAGSSMVQVCIQIKSLAITTSCEETRTNLKLSLHFLGCETAVQETNLSIGSFKWDLLAIFRYNSYDQMHSF